MARRFARNRVVRPSPSTKVWFSFNIGSTILSASTQHLISVLNAAALALRPFTILRTRLEVLYVTDQDAANEVPFGVFGMITVNDKASAVGISAVPAPVAQPDDDFFVYQPMSYSARQTTLVSWLPDGHHYVIDSKAMRKLDLGDDIATVFEQTAAVGAEIIMQGRMLVKIH